MSKRLTLATIAALATLGLTAPLFAQTRTSVSAAELDVAVVTRPVGSRQAVQTMLATDQALKVASQLGVGGSELATRVAALDQSSLDLLAERTGASDRNLAGGANTIVLSTTTILIAILLIIILTD